MRASSRLVLGGFAAVLAWPAVLAAQHAGPGHTPPMTDQEMIDNAESAAPEAVARDATVMAIDGQGNARTLRQGTNNFTCLPDNPMSPGNDPMCLDANGMEWAQAWMGKTAPPPGKVGFGYMLQGGSDASNADPHATEPAAGGNWVDTGPHVMIFNAGDMVATYPSQTENPDTRQPYVMWSGTPYEHLMIPVQ
ncbi:MAG TPA: hypothetical protein VFG47_16805, partial [Geminicoccaceae bacterium]|nr:hypothetical protein [Geminicoccaceae bacterium]